jgi:hypothetical protein
LTNLIISIGLKKKLFLEINSFIFYINNTKTPPDKDLYYKNINKIFSLDLTIKYINKKVEFKYNLIKTLGAIKIIIS